FVDELLLAAGKLGDLGVELLVLLVQAGLVALELAPPLAVLVLGGLRDVEGLVLGLEDDVLLLGPGFSEEPVGGGASGSLTVERDAPADHEGDPEADEQPGDEGDDAHDEVVGHDQNPFRVPAYAKSAPL